LFGEGHVVTIRIFRVIHEQVEGLQAEEGDLLQAVSFPASCIVAKLVPGLDRYLLGHVV
jgi:hypothetical protein